MPRRSFWLSKFFYECRVNDGINNDVIQLVVIGRATAFHGGKGAMADRGAVRGRSIVICILVVIFGSLQVIMVWSWGHGVDRTGQVINAHICTE